MFYTWDYCILLLMTDYSTIYRPYDNLLSRTDSDPSNPTVGVNTSGGNTSVQQASGGSPMSGGTDDSTKSGGSVATVPVKSDGNIGDLWIQNFIRSMNWKPRTSGFTLDGATGYAEFTDVYVSGDIHALTGSIGGFVINSESISDVANTFGLSSTVTVGDDVRFWAGDTYVNRQIAPFRVTESGVLFAASGFIGGSSIGSTFMSSTPFVSGNLGTGWRLQNTGEAEFQNAIIRGVIKTSVFEKDTISAVNGVVMITKSDVLSVDMTSLDASTITISGETTFVNNEVIRIKDGIDDEWMLVTNASSAPTYVVTRDLAGSYTADTNPVWTKGTAVVSMGVGSVANTGFITLDSSSSNSPFIDIYNRNSTAYADVTLRARLGWLKGIVDTTVGLNSTDVWGLYSDSVYLKGTINATSGRIGSTDNYWNITSNGIEAVSVSGDVKISYGKTDFSDFANDGFILGFDYSANQAKFLIGDATTYLEYDAGGLTIENGDISAANIYGSTVTGTTITGGLIRTSSSGARVEIDGSNDTLEIFDSGGDRRVMLDADKLLFYNEGGSEIGYIGGGLLGASQILTINLTSGLTGRGLVVYDDGTEIFNVSPTDVYCPNGLTLGGHLTFDGQYDIEGVDDIRFYDDGTGPGRIYMYAGIIDMGSTAVSNGGITSVGYIDFDAYTFTSLSSAGRMAYYDNGSTQQFRGRAGSYFGKFDLSAP